MIGFYVDFTQTVAQSFTCSIFLFCVGDCIWMIYGKGEEFSIL